MATFVSVPPFERDSACVTCPINFVPLGMISRLSVAFIASVVCATTASPLFAFFESIEVSNSALIAVPPAIDAWLFVVSEGAGDCAIAPAANKIERKMASFADFMKVDLLKYGTAGRLSFGLV